MPLFALDKLLISDILIIENTKCRKEVSRMKTRTSRKLKVRERKVAEKAIKVRLPFKPYARLTVLGSGLDKHQIPLNKVVDLSKLKVGGKSFEDLISSRPLIGSTTVKGLKKKHYACEAIKKTPSGRISVVRFTRIR